MIGADGLTDAVMRETDAALSAHGLIKIRVANDDRAARELWYQSMAAELNAAPVQHIGKLLVIWRPAPEEKSKPASPRRPRAASARSKRSFQGSTRK